MKIMRKKIITIIILLFGLTFLSIGLTLNEINLIPDYYLSMNFGT